VTLSDDGGLRSHDGIRQYQLIIRKIIKLKKITIKKLKLLPTDVTF